MVRRRRVIIGFVVAAALSITAVIGVSAQSGGGAPPAQETFINKLAANLGISADQVKAALEQTATQIVDEGVASGRIPPDKAGQLKQRIAEGKGLLPGGPGKHRGPGRGGPGGPHGPGGAIADAAALFGVDPQTLISELQSGKTLAQVGAEHGKTRDQLKADLIAAASAGLDKLVADGRITAEQKASMLGRAMESIEKLLDGSLPPRAGGDRAFRFPFQPATP